MKYHIYRRSKLTGKIEVLRTKCSDQWCDQRYSELYPDRVWKFSRQGAIGIVNRKNDRNWNYEYWIEPIESA